MDWTEEERLAMSTYAEWEAEHGALTNGERAAADRQLDQLLG